MMELLLLILSSCCVSYAYMDGASKDSCYDHSISHQLTNSQSGVTQLYPATECRDPCGYQLDIVGIVRESGVVDQSPLLSTKSFIYECNAMYELTLRQAGANGFLGFLVQARNDTAYFDPTSSIIGEWTGNSTLYKPLHCNSSMADTAGTLFPNSATQRLSNDLQGITRIPLYWLSPSPSSTSSPVVSFWYTVVEHMQSNFLPKKGPMGIPNATSCYLPPTTSTTTTPLLPTTASTEPPATPTMTSILDLPTTDPPTTPSLLPTTASTEPPRSIMECENVPSIANGRAIYSATGGIIPSTLAMHQEGAVVTYECDNELILGGESKRTCINGVWTGVPPICSDSVILCLSEVDSMWGIQWPNTDRDTFVSEACPEQSGSGPVSGEATRLCNSIGMWQDVNLSQCKSVEFINILKIAASLSNATITEETVRQTIDLSMQLVNVTKPSEMSLLPSSLDSTNEAVSVVLDVLGEILNDTQAVEEAGELVVDVLDNVLNENNTQGWSSLQMISPGHGSQILLSNAEKLSLLLAQSQVDSKSESVLRLSRPNIAISARQYSNDTEFMTQEDLRFPQEKDLVNYTLSVTPAEIQIPFNLVQERLHNENGEGLPIAFIVFRNIETFLPVSASDSTISNTQSVSVVISAQVGERSQLSQLLHTNPISLSFSFDYVNNASSPYHCVFWNFSLLDGNGQWDTTGIETTGNSSNGSINTVQCLSTHLTSFAVLVNVVGGVTGGMALEIVSYIGCGISLVCLLITIIFFLWQWKVLLEAVHKFVHLNLSITLFCAYLAFVAGVEPAKTNAIGCTLVAALLHYLFLASFCWMLCEGVMLYLMLVVVFSRVAKAWWFFLTLGYLAPLPIVAVNIGIRWEQYGVKDDNDKLQFCWLSTENGTIFGFVGPMIGIILINIVFFVLALRALWKSKSSKMDKQLKLARSLLLATVVLLPLLGLTWAFGLLTVDDNTTVFAWIFTVLNSLQGLAVLFFHVIRSKEMQKKLSLKKFKARWSKLKYGKMSSKRNQSLLSTSTNESNLSKPFSRRTANSLISSEVKPDMPDEATVNTRFSNENSTSQYRESIPEFFAESENSGDLIVRDEYSIVWVPPRESVESIASLHS